MKTHAGSLTIAVSTLIWSAFQFVWLSTDRLLRDGDEEGHIGAAELFAQQLESYGWLKWGWEMWVGDYGQYPPFYAALLGAWWHLVGQNPEELALRVFPTLCHLFTALVMLRIAGKIGACRHTAYVLTLFLPLASGLSRHYMPETLMTLFSVATIWVALKAQDQREWLIPTGLMMGAGMMTKQSFVFVAVPTALWILRSQWKRIWKLLFGMVTVCGPWYFMHLYQQQQYASSTFTQELGVSAHLSFYLHQIPVLIWGPPLTGLVIIGLIKKRTLPGWVWVWLCCAVIFVLMPIKYPRLLLAWAPIGALIAAIVPSKWKNELMILVAAHTLFASLVQQPQVSINDRCPQVWLRPASQFDGGLKRIETAAKLHQGALVLSGDAVVDCKTQTTFPVNEHLEAYLRRRGIEREIIDRDTAISNWQPDRLLLHWEQQDGLPRLTISSLER